MTTSKITRNYWIDKAKGWAEAKLSPPQADEFNSVMDELVDEDEAAQKEIERLQTMLAAANEDADKLAHGLEYFFSQNGAILADMYAPLIAHKKRMEQTK